MAADLDSLLERLDARPAAADSLEGQRLHRAVRARLLDETVAETRIDRFVITGRLGVGGMGVVYAAHDAQLDRKLAIKLVRQSDPAERERDQQRLIREARSLAQLSHPNVVAIYDVGLHKDRVFIAMELVAGTTLRAWVGDGSRPWDEVLRCFVQAGEGLAAAHAAGIVHRDFKPDNVLVGEDGRVRVLDFGLAQGDATSPTIAAPSAAESLSSSLTASGKVAGTPAYMAPEQFAGAPGDPRTDQFSFCVACWEALFLERPYPATSVAQLRAMMADGAIAEPSAQDRAPAWLRDVLARGLAVDPDARWPSMRALLDALAPERRRRGPWKIVAAAVAGGVALTLGGSALWRSQQRAGCERDASERIALWNADAAATMVDAFGATELVHARDTATRVGGLLDDYTGQWAQTHERGCLAHLGGAIDDDAWARRQACLDDRRERLATLLEVLHAPDREVVNTALNVVYELPLASACDDDARLAANAATLGASIDPARVAEVRRSLARAELLADAIRPTAIPAAHAVFEQARTLGDPSLVAEAELAVGTAHLRLGEYRPAAEAYERAYFGARPIGADEIALVAATHLVDAIGIRLARFDDGLEWSRHAAGLLPQSGSARAWREAEIAEHVASVLREKADIDGARASLERAIALRTEYAGADHPAVGLAWSELGGMLAQRGDADEAEPALDEAERILVAAYGPDSLEVALVINARGSIARFRGNFQASADLYTRALAIREARLEPDHPAMASALTNLSGARLSLEDFEGARELLVRVVELRRKTLGPLHPLLASSLNNLGHVDSLRGDARAAVAYFAEALQIRRTSLPPGHPDIAATLNGIGDAYQVMRELERALASYEEAAEMTKDGNAARIHGRALTSAGLVRLELGDPVRARADLEAALATPFGDEPDPTSQCGLRYGLVRAALEIDGMNAQAREQARKAYDSCREIGVDDAGTLEDLSSWARGEVRLKAAAKSR